MTGHIHGIARQLTGPGRSAIATIRVEGDLTALDVPDSLFRAVNGKPVAEFAINALYFGVWGDPGEDVVVCRTGDDSLEITCHGGVAAVSRVLADLAGRGFSTMSGGVQLADDALRRSDAQRRVDTSAGLHLPLSVLQGARTQRTAEILLEQVSGTWDRFVTQLADSRSDDARTLIEQALTRADFGRHLIEPWNVVLCGRPNVGKSSLMNSLAGFTRSIVSEQAGTTRDRVTLETAIDGWPVRITDTAGIRETQNPIEREGVAQTLAAIDEADLVLIVLDRSEPLTAEDYRLLDRQPRRRIVIAHKADLAPATQDRWPLDTLAVSSVSGNGIESLLKTIASGLVPQVPDHGCPVPVTRQQVEWLERLCHVR